MGSFVESVAGLGQQKNDCLIRRIIIDGECYRVKLATVQRCSIITGCQVCLYLLNKGFLFPIVCT